MPSRILIVDDASFMRMMLRNILTSHGHTIVAEAENGLKAIEAYQQSKPDIMLIDLIMPEMGGIEAVKRIMEIDPQAKVVICSAMGQQALVVEAMQAGACDFIIKPFQPTSVIEAVQKLEAGEG
ncbi:MAG: response regulator [Candidatus Firestonebacteria bacterium]|nr:response regulator [Candidatus Firestonebacteria bacterium]